MVIGKIDSLCYSKNIRKYRMAPMDGKVQHILFTFGGQIRDRDNTVLTNDSKISTIVPWYQILH